MTEAQLIEAVRKGAVSLPNSETQSMFPSGQHMRDWADKNSMKLTVTKGFVTIEASGKPISTSSVADEVAKVAKGVRRRL